MISGSYWVDKASTIVGAKKVEEPDWVYRGKITLIATHLQAAYVRGRSDMRDELTSVVTSCCDRDPTLEKMRNCFEDMR